VKSFRFITQAELLPAAAASDEEAKKDYCRDEFCREGIVTVVFTETIMVVLTRMSIVILRVSIVMRIRGGILQMNSKHTTRVTWWMLIQQPRPTHICIVCILIVGTVLVIIRIVAVVIIR
jgi:hypothetical protein